MRITANAKPPTRSKYADVWEACEATRVGEFVRVDDVQSAGGLRSSYANRYGNAKGVQIHRGTKTVWLPGRAAEETAA